MELNGGGLYCLYSLGAWPTVAVALLIAANHDSSPFRMKQRVSNLQPEGSLSDDDHTDSER